MVDYKTKGFNPHIRKGYHEDLFLVCLPKEGHPEILQGFTSIPSAKEGSFLMMTKRAVKGSMKNKKTQFH